MRIIAGQWRRRTLVAPKGTTTRPTTDRVREALFQHLESARLPNAFADLRVLDLFAGSGALGLEALSRGASAVVAIERDRAALQALLANKTALRADTLTVVKRTLPNALDGLPDATFDLCFADPPYATPLDAAFAARLLRVMRPDALWVYEHHAQHTPTPFPSWTVEGMRTYGDTAVSFLRPCVDVPS